VWNSIILKDWIQITKLTKNRYELNNWGQKEIVQNYSNLEKKLIKIRENSWRNDLLRNVSEKITIDWKVIRHKKNWKLYIKEEQNYYQIKKDWTKWKKVNLAERYMTE
jgi:hypothetical protein